MFPESTNDQYRGAVASAWFLGLLAIGSIIPGCIHYFLPDGGAEVIAGLDLGAERSLVIGVFAWMGATQIPYGLAQLAVATRYRSLVPFVLTKSQGAEDLFNASIENLLKPNFDKAAGLNVSDSPDKKSFMQMMTITSKDNENTSEFLLIRLGRGYFSAEPKQYLDQSLEQEPLQNEAACLFEKSDDAK